MYSQKDKKIFLLKK